MAKAKPIERGRVLFVHGLWMHPTSWQPWIQEFEQSGYDCEVMSRPDPPGLEKAARTGNALRADHGLRDSVGLLRDRYAADSRPPIIIGHGVGGVLAEAALAIGLVPATVSIAAPPTGPRFVKALLRNAVHRPRIAPVARQHRPCRPPYDQFAATFANAIDRADARRIYDTYVVPDSPRDAARWLLRQRRTRYPGPDRRVPIRSPLLLIGGGKDRLVREADVSNVFQRYRRQAPDSVTDLEIFPDRDHSLTVEPRWLTVAFYCLDWLTAHDL